MWKLFGSSTRPSSTATTPSPFSIAHLEALHLTLTKQRAFSAAAFAASDKAGGASGASSSAVAKGATFGYDASVVVETLKQISELMVYGDKNNAERFFEVFCERNMLRTFVDLFQEGGGAHGNPRHDEVRVQVLQTVSILLMNIANQRSLFYLLSNNFVNELISSPFDMNHEELLGY
jgi:hypothetical protein